jgi:hypothetical protein
MEKEVLWEIITGLLVIITGMIGFNLKSHKADYEKLKDSHSGLALKVSEEYAKKSDLNAARLETTESLKRVYDKIEAVDDNLDRKISEIPDKIVKLMRREQ